MQRALTGAVVLCLAGSPTVAQDVPIRLQSIADYLLDESVEVALATSAAPERIGAHATVLVLRRDGHHELRPGTNGFTCLVERSWSSPVGIHRDFFNPKLRAPICYNREGARTVLGEYLRRTELALAGKSITEIKRAIDTDLAEGTLRAPRGLAMSYMASADQLLGTRTGQFIPHIMVYVPYATREDLGPNPGGSDFPHMFEHEGGPFAAVIVPLPRFTNAPEHEGGR